MKEIAVILQVKCCALCMMKGRTPPFSDMMGYGAIYIYKANGRQTGDDA